MNETNRELYDFIKGRIETSGIDVRGLDRDRKALENLGVW
jgi:hypothetical protein